MNLGRFNFEEALIKSQPELFLPVFSEVVVLHATLLDSGSIEYLAFSNRFDEVIDCVIPQYNVTPTTNGVDVVKVNT